MRAPRAAPSFDFSRIMIDRRAFMLGSAATAGCWRRRATGYPGYAFVANSRERSVAVVDLTRFSVTRQIQLEADPTAVVACSRRHTVYALTAQNASIYEIDTADLKVKRKLLLGGTAVSMRLAADETSLWVLCRSPHLLVRVALDDARFAAASRLKLPAEPADFDLSRDGLFAAASFPETRTAALIDLAKPAVINVAAAGDDPRAVLLRSDGKQMLVANRRARMITVLDVKTGGTLVRLPLPVEPENLCVKADGGQVFITGTGMDAVVVVYPYWTEVAETVLAGKAPGAMAISTKPEYLFAANPESGDVTVLEVETRGVLAAVKVGQEPCYITFTPDDQYALVVNHGSGDLAVIRLATITQNGSQRRSRTAPLFTMVPVGVGPVSAAVVGV
jgi:YVTN family beta-propeller protein